MWMVDLKYIHRAVQSLSACTAPQFVFNGVLAKASGLCSPYLSHQRVEFVESYLWEDVLLARNQKHGLLLSRYDLAYLENEFGEHGLLSMWRHNVPQSCHVSTWAGGRVPASLAQPLLERVRDVGLGMPLKDYKTLYAYAVRPVLAGWHYRQPVFRLTSQPVYTETGAEKPLLEIVELKGQPVATQGHLQVYNRPSDASFSTVYPGLDELVDGEWFYNHRLDHADPDITIPLESGEARRVVWPDALRMNGSLAAAVLCKGPCTLRSPEHQPLKLGEGEYLLVHPFPEAGVD